MTDSTSTVIDINKAPLSEPTGTPTPFQSQLSFAQKLVNVEVQLASNPQQTQPSTFTSIGSGSIQLAGHRTRARIGNATAPGGSGPGDQSFDAWENVNAAGRPENAGAVAGLHAQLRRHYERFALPRSNSRS